MTLDVLKLCLKEGDKNGSALRELLKYCKIKDNDLSHIDDAMALKWLESKTCSCWHDGRCWGTKDREWCTCGGNKLKCNFM
jgi:hypothetical protein